MVSSAIVWQNSLAPPLSETLFLTFFNHCVGDTPDNLSGDGEGNHVILPRGLTACDFPRHWISVCDMLFFYPNQFPLYFMIRQLHPSSWLQKYILEQQAKAAVEPKRNSISPKGIKEQSLTINSTDDDEIKGIFSNWYHLP